MKMNTLFRSVVGGTMALLLVGIPLFTPAAQAATQAELQAQIQSLLAQVSSLQAQLSNKAQTHSCSVFSRNLTLGSSGTEVTNLQNFLIGKGYSIPAGATGYFGGQTQQALAHFQKAEGVNPAVGYFGPLTRGHIQNMCTPVTTPTTPTTPDTPAEDITLSGEAFIDRFTVKDGNDTDLEEGDTNAEIMEVSFRVTDGDVKINRFDLGFTPDTGNNEKDPWDTFGTIAVYQGTKKIADIDGSRERNWKEDSPAKNDYLLRLSGLNWVIKETKTVDLKIKATVQKNELPRCRAYGVSALD